MRDRTWGLIVLLFVSSLAVLAEDKSLSETDSEYIQHLWTLAEDAGAIKDAFVDWTALEVKPDLKRIRSVASNAKSDEMVSAWKLLASLENPSQLHFLVSLATPQNEFRSNLAAAISRAVHTEEDVQIVLPLLKSAAYFPDIIPAFNHSKSADVRKYIIDKKWADSDIDAPWVAQYIEFQVDHDQSFDPKEAEPFMLEYIQVLLRTFKPYSDRYKSCLAANWVIHGPSNY